MSQHGRDAGYTLIEVMVTISLLGVLMAISVIGFDHWSAASQQAGTAREVQTLMRQAQQRAITEGRAMCVSFDTSADSYTLYRGACDDTAKQKVNGPFETDGGQVQLEAPVFTGTSTPTGVTFFARGTATPGSVHVTSSASTKVYILDVEGLTGRVSLG